MGYMHEELPIMAADLQPWFLVEVVLAALAI